MVIAQELRKAVLLAAISGKLTDQQSSDGIAEDLIQRIKSDHIKKGAEMLDESPFDIPDNWTWCALNDLGTFSSGKTPDMSNLAFWQAGTVQWFTSKDMKAKYLADSKMKITEYAKEDMKYYPAGTILMVVRSGILKHSLPVCILTVDATINQDIKAFVLYENAMSEYLYIVLKGLETNILQNYTKRITTVESLRFDDFSIRMPIPIPPLREQQRIVERVNRVMAQIDEYEQIEKQLIALKAQFPLDIQSAILQSALQGELTNRPQYFDVDQLLEDSIQQRKKLIQAKVLKNEKIVPLSDNDFPFDIPDEWRFVRLGNIIRLLSGQDFTPDKYFDTFVQGSMPYITGASNMENGTILINRWTNTGKSIAHKGELLLSCKGTVGKMAFLHVDEAHIARQIMSISPLAGNNIKYIAYCIKNFVMKLRCAATSMIPGIDRSMILNLVVPLPPIEEQACIVARLDELLPLCDSLIE